MKIDKNALIEALKASAEELIDTARIDLQQGALVAATLIDDLIANHGDSDNFEELAKHVAAQIKLDVAVRLWNLANEAAERVRLAALNIIRGIIVTGIAAL
jgi:hypothetical protein